MLVLQRNVDEDLVITAGDQTIIVKLVRVTSDHSARIGIDAGENVKVMRRELVGKEQAND